MNRTGKIARLPRALRDQINQRLQNGESGEPLLAWLNRQPKVKAILKKQFAGVPISKQNLSDWRKGGYAEWEFKGELSHISAETVANALEFDPPSQGWLSDSVSVVLTARYAALVHHWNGEVTDELQAKLKVLRAMIQDISRVRRADHSATKVRLAVSKYEAQSEPAEAEPAKPVQRPAGNRSTIPPFQLPTWNPPTAQAAASSTPSIFPAEAPTHPAEVPAPNAGPDPSNLPSLTDDCQRSTANQGPTSPSSPVKPSQGTLAESAGPSPDPVSPANAVTPKPVTPKAVASKPLRTSYDVWSEHVAQEIDEYILRRLPPGSRPTTEVTPKTIYDSQRGTFAILTDPDQPYFPGDLRWGKGLPPEKRPYRPTMCRGKCNLADGSCTGCQRTEDEITLWPVLNRPERVAYIHKILERRLASGLIK